MWICRSSFLALAVAVPARVWAQAATVPAQLPAIPSVVAPVSFADAGPLPAPPAIAPNDARDGFQTLVPGRVPLVIESEGSSQSVQRRTDVIYVTRSGRARSTAMMQHLCDMPCTLYVPPGPFTFATRGENVWPADTTVSVPQDGLRLRMYAPSTRAKFGAASMVVAGGLFLVAGVIVVIIGASEVADHGQHGADLLVFGGITAALGGVLAEAGNLLFEGRPTGVHERLPIRLPHALSFGVGPTTGGGVGGMTLRF